MLLETAQLLSTTHRLLTPIGEINEQVYRTTHINHPCNIWLRQSKANYLWLVELFQHLETQYELRYYKQHMSYIKLYEILKIPPINIPDVSLTTFALAMPDIYKQADPVEAYRSYYRGQKLNMSKWTLPAKVPYWVYE